MCRYACLCICVCGCVSDGCVCGCADVCHDTCACVCMQIYIYVYESEQGASKEREPVGGEEKTERESRLISCEYIISAGHPGLSH